MRFNAFDCPKCNGLGLIISEGISKCKTCDGTGHRHPFKLDIQYERPKDEIIIGKLKFVEGTGMSYYGGLYREENK